MGLPTLPTKPERSARARAPGPRPKRREEGSVIPNKNNQISAKDTTTPYGFAPGGAAAPPPEGGGVADPGPPVDSCGTTARFTKPPPTVKPF